MQRHRLASACELPVFVNSSYDSTDCSRGNSVKGDLKGTMQAKAKQYKIDLGVCKETVGRLTTRVDPLSRCLSQPPPRLLSLTHIVFSAYAAQGGVGEGRSSSGCLAPCFSGRAQVMLEVKPYVFARVYACACFSGRAQASSGDAPCVRQVFVALRNERYSAAYARDTCPQRMTSKPV